ncbi:hypothetical protein J4461_01380 [Candidatus Pacearchaeota archaeon]|nr:hypothetical protein [Candidatus Pacearchaeota archaeon]
MARREVKIFFATLILLSLVLATIQVASFGTLTGRAIMSGEQVLTNSNIEAEAFAEKEFTYIYLYSRGSSEFPNHISVSYSVDNGRGGKYHGSQEILSGSESPYISKLYTPSLDEGSSVIVETISGGEIEQISLPISKNKINIISGRAIGSSPRTPILYAGLVLMAIFIISYVTIARLRKRSMHTLAAGIDSRFIQLRDLSR